jgi:hypothetical protein
MNTDKPHPLCKKKNIVCWCEERPLSWDDFQGKSEAKGYEFAGISNWYIYKTRYNKKGGVLKVWIYAYVDTKMSWKIENGNSEYGLHHEQMHFNIQEVFARQIRKAFQEMKFDTGIPLEEAYNELDNVFKYYRQEASKTQKVYDEETAHSMNREKQNEWDEKIMKELEQLKDYANPEFDIVLP